MVKAAAVLLVLAANPLPAAGQSLGSAADREKDRHKKNQDEGVQVRVVSEEELTKDHPVELPPGTPTPEPKAALPVARPPSPQAGAPRPSRKEAKSAGNGSAVPAPAPGAVAPPREMRLANPDRDAAERGTVSADWPERMAQARARLAWAQRNRDLINGRLADPSPRPADETASYEDHDRLTGSPAQLRAILLRVQIEIEVAQKTVEALEAEGRKGSAAVARANGRR